MGLEALFGPDDTGETTYKLCQRIAFFLGDRREVTRELYWKAKTCYNTRSKIARTAVRHLLDNPDMLKTFVSKQRDRSLEDWVFSRSTDPPPFPK